MRPAVAWGAVLTGFVVLTGCGLNTASPLTMTSTSAAAPSSSAASSAPVSTTAPVGLDGPSAKWFDTLCTGMAPASKLTGQEPADNSPGGVKKFFLSAVRPVASSFTATATALAQMPDPTIRNGELIADSMITALSQTGTGLSGSLDKLAAVDAKNVDGITKAVAQLNDNLGQVANVLTSLGTALNTDGAAAADIAAIPSCKALTQPS